MATDTAKKKERGNTVDAKLRPPQNMGDPKINTGDNIYYHSRPKEEQQDHYQKTGSFVGPDSPTNSEKKNFVYHNVFPRPLDETDEEGSYIKTDTAIRALFADSIPDSESVDTMSVQSDWREGKKTSYSQIGPNKTGVIYRESSKNSQQHDPSPKIPHLLSSKPQTFQFSHVSWYHGNISEPQAKGLIRSKPIGTFLCRDSSQPNCLALEFVRNGLEKVVIRYNQTHCWFPDSEHTKCPSLEELAVAYSNILLHPVHRA